MLVFVGFVGRDASVPCVFFVAAPLFERSPISLVEQAIPKSFKRQQAGPCLGYRVSCLRCGGLGLGSF